MLSRRQFLLATLSGMALAQVGGLSHADETCQIVTPQRSVLINKGNPDLAHYCLTYDDCWDEALTYQLGVALAEQGIRATFFPAGRAIRANLDNPTFSHENLYPRLLEMGHEFGCHTFTHSDITDFSARYLINNEITPWQLALEEALGKPYTTVAFRPPFGIVTDALFNASTQTGLPIVLWTADMGDHLCTGDCLPTLEARFERTLTNGAVYLHHCTQGAVDVLPFQVATATAQDMTHVPLSQLLQEWCEA